MDEQTTEVIKQLIADSLVNFQQTILETVDKKNAGLGASLTREIRKLSEQPKPETEEPSESKLTLKSLEQQIVTLNQQLAEKDKQAFQAARSAAISKLIANTEATNKSALQKLFGLQYADRMQQEGDAWFIEENGQVLPIDQALSAYLQSPEGLGFVPPASSRGSGSSETRPVFSSNNAEMTLDQRYEALFQQVNS